MGSGEREGRKKERVREGGRDERTGHAQTLSPAGGLWTSQPPTIWLYVKDTSSNADKREPSFLCARDPRKAAWRR